jgi:hypothetical protein
MVRASTSASPNEGVTSGSLSIQHSGRAIRQACAEIRQLFLAAASDRLGVDPAALAISDGTISGPGNVRTSYWELAGEVSLDRDATPVATPKSVTQRALAGHSVQRVDIPDKVFAHPRFIHDTALPGMLHGRVLRPDLSRAKLVDLKEDAARTVPGLVAIVRDGSFSGVVCETERSADTALMVGGRGAAGRERSGGFSQGPAGRIDRDRHQDGNQSRCKGANRPAAIHPSLRCACLDRAFLRDGAVERRPGPGLDP